MCRIVDPIKTGQRLHQLCVDHGLSAKDIMTLLNLSDRRCVYYWFSGKTLPTVDNLFLLSGILGVAVDEILVARDSSEK